MKKYLKMADVFNECEVVETDVKVLFAVTEEYDDCVTPHEYAHHAIECHDELVQMNQELLEIINRIIGTSKELQNKHAISGWACGYKQCSIDTGHALCELMEKYKEKRR